VKIYILKLNVHLDLPFKKLGKQIKIVLLLVI